MNLAEMLLAVDAGKITKKATKDYEVKRLTQIMGEPFVLHLKEIPFNRVRNIQNQAAEKGEDGTIIANMYKLQMGMLCAGIANMDFDNRDVLKRFGAANRKELFEKLFNAGEIQHIAEEISELCGFGRLQAKQVIEIKN